MSVQRQHFTYASATARHISAEGCQFVVGPDRIAEGQRLRFALEGHPAVRGTVRWVVGDRIGFAFDRPISHDAQKLMQERCRVVEAVELYLS